MFGAVGARLLGAAGAAALLSTASLAADLPPLPPPAPVAVAVGGWYLRGDVGVGIQRFQSFDFTQTNIASGAVWPATWQIEQKDIKNTFLIDFGIGYAWNNWLRFDFTSDYRADVKFKAVGSYINFPQPQLGRAFDVYDGDHAALVLLANVYFDLGTWWCLTPFVGVGAGSAFHMTSAVSDTGLNADGLGASAFGFTRTDHSQWDFAWAAHAGLAYTVTNNFKVEFSYRYLNFGNADTSEVLCGASGCGTGQGPRAFYTLHNFTSNDLRIGVRWLFQPEPVYSPPLIRKG